MEEYIHPHNQPQVLEAIGEALRSKSPFELEHRVRRVDGTLDWTSSRANPLRDAWGAIIEWFGTASDITARKEAVVMRLAGGDNTAVQLASAMMERQIGQMVRLVDHLLDVSRISRGNIELRKERVELASAIQHAVEAARSLVDGMEHALTVTLPPRPLCLNADPTRLAQVIGNLLNNACKLSYEGGRYTAALRRRVAGLVLQQRCVSASSRCLPRSKRRWSGRAVVWRCFRPSFLRGRLTTADRQVRMSGPSSRP